MASAGGFGSDRSQIVSVAASCFHVTLAVFATKRKVCWLFTPPRVERDTRYPLDVGRNGSYRSRPIGRVVGHMKHTNVLACHGI
eukprot:6471916-Amphidinium_carterae.1